MHTPYVRAPKAPRRSRWITDTGFRLLRVLPVEINAQRLAHHIKWELKRDQRSQAGRRFRMKLRRLEGERA